MKREQELREEIIKLRRELDEIEQAEAEKKNCHLVGKCYRYKNSYGGGSWWWRYRRVTTVNGNDILCFVFEKKPNAFEVRVDDWLGALRNNQEISEDEFRQAWREFLVELNGIGLKRMPSI